MKPVMIIGLVLLLAGGALLAFGYVKYRDTDPVVEIGDFKIEQTHTEKRRIHPAIGGTLMGVGAILTVVGALKRR